MDERDHLQRRCPRLGGPVTFRYCRDNGGEELPCWKVFDCWWEHFDIVACMREDLSEEQFTNLKNTQPTPKVQNIIELVRQAKGRTK